MGMTKAPKKEPMRRNPMGQNDFSTRRDIANASFRALTEEEGGSGRTYELSFSSEEPVSRWYGNEILDHTDGAVDLSRITDLGVILFNHHQDDVIGKVTKAWIEDGRGKARIEFDDDDASERIRKKVESGTLRGVSVGYRVDSWEEVVAGKKSKDGRFTGPAYIAVRWEPLEISIVSVPADATVGVGRSEEDPADMPTKSLDLCERIVRVNENALRGGKA